MSHFVLASTSRYRAQLLQRLGLPFSQVAPECDEEAWKERGLEPPELVTQLAAAKAQSVAATHPHDIVIGSDQLAHYDGHILGKPGTAAQAVQQLSQLSGRAHQLLTAVCIMHQGKTYSHLDTTTLTMRQLDQDALERYVARDQPLDCAASYKLECSGISLFSSIVSDDHSAITGLPLLWVTATLTKLGLAIP